MTEQERLNTIILHIESAKQIIIVGGEELYHINAEKLLAFIKGLMPLTRGRKPKQQPINNEIK